MADRFRGVFSTNVLSGRRSVNYEAAIKISELHGLPDTLIFLEKLEAIVKGLNEQ